MTKHRRITGLILLAALFITSSCGVESEGQKASYNETKTMVLDILRTDDGVRAIKEAQYQSMARQSGSGNEDENQGENEGTFKLLSVDEQHNIRMAVKEMLTDENNNKMLQQLMTDPKFAGDFAKAITSENKKLQKELIQDPEYQQSMLQLMKNPEHEKMILDLMKSSQYRKQTMSAVQEVMKSPLFKAELLPLLQKVVSEELKTTDSKGDNKQEEQGQEKEQSGGESEGEDKEKEQGNEEDSEEEQK